MQCRYLTSLAAIISALALSTSSCMRAERLATDTNSPEGFALGEFTFGFGSGSSPAAPTYTIGGTLVGYAGQGLVLQNNGGDDLNVPARATSFAFATALRDGAAYSVGVQTPANSPLADCSVTSSATGTVSGANVTNVIVTCVERSWPGTANAAAIPGFTTTNTLTTPVVRAGIDGAGSVHVLASDWASGTGTNYYRWIKNTDAAGWGSQLTLASIATSGAAAPEIDLAVNEAGRAYAIWRHTTLATGYDHFDGNAWATPRLLAFSGFSSPHITIDESGQGLAVLVDESNGHPIPFPLNGMTDGAAWATAAAPACNPSLGYANWLTTSSNGTSAFACASASGVAAVFGPSTAATGWAANLDTSAVPFGMYANPFLNTPVVAINDGGQMVMAYRDSTANVYAAHYDGHTWGPLTLLQALTNANKLIAAGIDASGNAVVAWSGDNGVFACFKDSAGWCSVPARTGTTANTFSPNAGLALKVNPAGSGFVAWTNGNGGDLFVSSLNTSTGTVGSEHFVGNDVGSNPVSLAVNNKGQAVVAWWTGYSSVIRAAILR